MTVLTAAGHRLIGKAQKGVWRRWVCERCHAVLQVDPDLDIDTATRALVELAQAHGGKDCP